MKYYITQQRLEFINELSYDRAFRASQKVQKDLMAQHSAAERAMDSATAKQDELEDRPRPGGKLTQDTKDSLALHQGIASAARGQMDDARRQKVKKAAQWKRIQQKHRGRAGHGPDVVMSAKPTRIGPQDPKDRPNIFQRAINRVIGRMTTPTTTKQLTRHHAKMQKSIDL